MWQDWVIAIIQWLFAVFLIPSVFHPEKKPPFSTCITTSVGIFIVAYAVWTLGLLQSSLSASATGVVWGILAYQQYRIHQKTGKPLIAIPRWLYCFPPLG